MKITERDIIEALRGSEEADLEDTLEKIAAAEEVLNDHDLSLADLDDDEVLEVLSEAGVDEDELADVLEALEEEEEDEDEDEYEFDDEDVDEELLEKEAAAEDMYLRGYAYGAGFQDALADGMEKLAAAKAATPTIEEQIGTMRRAVGRTGRQLRFLEKELKRGQRFAKRERIRELLSGMFGKGAPKLTKKELREAPFLARLVRRMTMTKGGLSGRLSKAKLAGLGGGLAAGAGLGGYGLSRLLKKKKARR